MHLKRKIPALSFRQNSLLNITGGALMGFYAFLSPLVLSRVMDAVSYSGYVLGVQVASFLLIFATPLQVCLGPKFAILITDNSIGNIQILLRFAKKYYVIAALFASSVAIFLSVSLPYILSWEAKMGYYASKSIIFMGIGTAITFPAFIVTGFSAGCMNYIMENILKCMAPYLGLILVIIFWALYKSNTNIDSGLYVIGIMSGTVVLSGLFIMLYGIKFLPSYCESNCSIGARESGFFHLWDVTGSLWMQICSFFTISSGTFIVSRVNPDSVPAFAIAGSAMVVIAGITSALSGPLSVKIAQFSSDQVEKRVLVFKRFNRIFILCISGATFLLLCIPDSFFIFWVGSTFGLEVKQLLLPLGLANFLRQLTAPYSIAILGLGQQRKIWLSPFVEALLTVIFGLLFSQKYGAQGVAYGFLIASLARLSLTISYDANLTNFYLPLKLKDFLFPFDCRSK